MNDILYKRTHSGNKNNSIVIIEDTKQLKHFETVDSKYRNNLFNDSMD
jgi:hypothetical protein